MSELSPRARLYASRPAPVREYRRALERDLPELERQGWVVCGAWTYALDDVSYLLWRPIYGASVTDGPAPKPLTNPA